MFMKLIGVVVLTTALVGGGFSWGARSASTTGSRAPRANACCSAGSDCCAPASACCEDDCCAAGADCCFPASACCGSSVSDGSK